MKKTTALKLLKIKVLLEYTFLVTCITWAGWYAIGLSPFFSLVISIIITGILFAFDPREESSRKILSFDYRDKE